MLTGERAFAGSSATETLAAILREHPPDARTDIGPDVLGDLGVAIRADAVEPSSLAASIKGVVRSVDPGIAMHDVATLEG